MQYPTLVAAAVHMLQDQGIPSTSAEADVADLPYSAAQLSAVECYLAALTPENLETLCCGDQEDWAAIYDTMADGKFVHAVLDELFLRVGF